MRIIFMGTPEFAVPSLEKLVAEGYKPIAVVTGPDKPRGRGQQVTPTPVKEAALRLGIETILQPESVKDPAFAAQIAELDPDIIVVVAFRILPPEVFRLARRGTFNLHGSLLPRYRGAAPINRAIMEGETVTGVTTFFLQEKVDTGSIILQRSMDIGPDETAGEVHDRMMMLGAEVVVETVRLLEEGLRLGEPQDDRAASPAPKIFQEDCRIPWERSAADVHNHVRGLSPYPAAWTNYSDTRIKIFRTRVAEGEGRPGEIIECGPRIIVTCGTGAVEVLELQMEGRKRLSATDFLNGYSLQRGQTLT